MKRRYQAAVAAVAFILFLTGCSKNSGLGGKVVDVKGTPIAGVKVVANQVQPVKGYERSETITGSDGSFSLPKLFPASAYVLTTYTDGNIRSVSITSKSGPEGLTAILPEPISIRFIVSKDGITVRDTKTGLMWAQNANAAGRVMNWSEALSWVKGSNIGGFRDWRMPVKEELETLAMAGGKRPAEWFNINGMSNVQAGLYWSSTPYPNYTGYAWCVNMYGGYVYGYNKASNVYVWPVRTGK